MLPAGTVHHTETAGRLLINGPEKRRSFLAAHTLCGQAVSLPSSDCVLSFLSSNRAGQNLGTLLNGAASADAGDRVSCSYFHRCSPLGEGILLDWLAGKFFFF